MFSNILVPTDGSPLALSSVEKAVAFARDANATVTFVAVIEPFRIFSTDGDQTLKTREEYGRLAETQAAQFLTEAEMRARLEGVVCHTKMVEGDDIASAIIKTATRNGCDLIAMASHGRGGMSAFLLGSVTAKVLSRSDIPVLVYR